MAIKFFCDGCGEEVKHKGTDAKDYSPLNMVTIHLDKYMGGQARKVETPTVMELCDSCTEHLFNYDLPTKKGRVAKATTGSQ